MSYELAKQAYDACAADQLPVGGDISYCLTAAQSYYPAFVPGVVPGAVTTAPTKTTPDDKAPLSIWVVLLIMLALAIAAYFFFFYK